MKRRILLACLLVFSVVSIGGVATAQESDPNQVIYGLESDFAFIFNCAVFSTAFDDPEAPGPTNYEEYEQKCADLVDELADPEREEPGVNPGDAFLLEDELSSDNDFTGPAIGLHLVECTEFFSMAVHCRGTFSFDDDSSITWQGAIRFDPEAEFDPDAPFAIGAITGGTGDYFGASGQFSAYDITEYPEDMEDVAPEEIVTRYDITLE